MISIFIPTKNEERDLPCCLRSVEWSDDIHVYDSGSTDRTPAIAREFGATFTLAPSAGSAMIFGGDEAAHKNWAMENLPFRYPWVLHLDADERATAELAVHAKAAVAAPNSNVAFRVIRRDYFLGSWLKHAQATPFYTRLFRHDRMRFERMINPVSVPNGPVSDVSGYLDHYPFSKGIAHWLTKHNNYSSLEAQQILENELRNQAFSVRKAFVCSDPVEKRFHQKELFYRIPFRPMVKFLGLYLGKRGYLDGAAGFRYATLQGIYEYMIVLKTKELRLAHDSARQGASGR